MVVPYQCKQHAQIPVRADWAILQSSCVLHEPEIDNEFDFGANRKLAIINLIAGRLVNNQLCSSIRDVVSARYNYYITIITTSRKTTVTRTIILHLRHL